MAKQAQTQYGISEQRSAVDRIDVHVQEIQIAGFTVVESGFTRMQLSDWRDRVDSLLERQTAEGGGRSELAQIQEADVVRCPLAYDESFLAVATNEVVIEICRRLVGDYHVLMQQNAVVNPANQGHHQRAYHRDLPYQHWVSSRPLSVSALLCLDAFSRETGGTCVVPGTHKIEYFPSDECAQRLERTVEADAGCFLVFDSMLYHRAGSNSSPHPRRAINNVYTIPLIKQQISLPAALNGKWSDDPKLSRLLGYESESARSVEEFRSRRRSRR